MEDQPQIIWRPTERQAVALSSGAEQLFFGGARGGGKALALYTPIPTPSGWTTMGDLLPGDYILGSDGKPTKVLAKSEVMYGRKCLSVGFDCGETITCDAGHLWHTVTKAESQAAIRTTADIQLTLMVQGGNEVNHRIPVSYSGLPSQHQSATRPTTKNHFITAVDDVESVPVQCIAVDSPDHLYLAGRALIPTHNSDYLIFDWLSHAEQEAPISGILVRRTYDELEEIAARCQEKFTRLGLHYSASERTWRHTNGSQLKLRYLETVADASRYQGHEYQWVGIDEAGSYPSANVVDLLNGTLRTKRKGQRCLLRLTGNPGGPGHGWLKARFVAGHDAGTPHYCEETGVSRVFVPSKLEDNPHIEDVERYRARLAGSGPAHLVRAWLLGDWDILPNGGILNPDNIRPGKPPERERMRIYFGIDPAARDKDKTGGNPDNSAIAVVGVDPDRNMWLLDLWAEQRSSKIVWDQLLAMMRKWQPETVWVEGGPIGAAVLPLWEDAQDRLKTWWPIKEVSHMGDKVGKAQALAAAIDRGLVYADKTAPWYPALRDEATIFDGSKDRKDDRVDAVGIVMRMLRMTQAGEPESAAKAMLPPRSREAMGVIDPLTRPTQPKGGLSQRSAFRR